MDTLQGDMNNMAQTSVTCLLGGVAILENKDLGPQVGGRID